MSSLLLEPWTGPAGGVPPLDRVTVDAIEPAIDVAIARRLEAVEAIAADPAPPDFDNTIVPLEASMTAYWDVLVVYYLHLLNFMSDAFRPIPKRIEPRLAQLNDQIHQHPALYARVQAVAQQPDLTVAQRRTLEHHLRAFREAGAHLDQAGRERVAAINQRLATLANQFSENLLADEESHVTWLDADQTGGLSDSFLDSAKAAAVERGRPDAWAVLNTRSSVDPVLQSCTDRDVREAVWRAFTTRGGHPGEHDNNPLITEILTLRHERAVLLGHPTHAHFRTKPNMAGTPDAAMQLLRDVWKAASRKLATEVEALQALADADGVTIQPWDLQFYAERHRKQHHAFDPDELREYFQLENLREAMFWVAHQNYGWSFHPADVPVPHPDMRAWEVRNADGSTRGMFYFDPYARPGKRSGAWMTAWRVQHRLGGGSLPIVSNNCNFIRATGDRPTLIGADDARTLFHEFGHAIHGLASDTDYPSIAGTSVPQDFVEFPSQLNEHWLLTDEVLERFARHRVTGAPPPAELVARLRAVANADAGFRTMEYLASAVLDLEMHLHDGPIDDPAAFERQVMERWALPPQLVARHRPPHFQHLFAGESYSAGYYSYLWADMLVADAAEAFADAGFYDGQLARKLMGELLSRGDSVDHAQAYRRFRGRDPEPGALLRDRGFDEGAA